MVIAILKSIAIVAVAGCYAPSVQDCALTCVTEADCAQGQKCDVDGWCAAPARVGQCDRATDAGTLDVGPRADASRAHDASMIETDAASPVELEIVITGMGDVTLDSGPRCSSMGPQHGSCVIDVPYGVVQILHAVPGPGNAFVGWTMPACAGQGIVCTLTPISTTPVDVSFAHGNGPQR